MSLNPSALAIDKAGMYVVFDDPESDQVLLVPCSWAHRMVIDRAELDDYELHAAGHGGEHERSRQRASC